MSSNKDHGKNFLEESRGNRSMMRLMSLIAVISASVFTFIIITSEGATRLEVYLVVAFLVGGFAPKVFQKYAEKVTEV